MIKLNSDLLNQLSSRSLNFSNNESQSKNVKTTESLLSSTTYSASQTQSFTFFHRTVQKNVEQALPGDDRSLDNDFEQAELEAREDRANIASGNILSFIERRLAQDAKDGATEEELESRLNAALEGFEKGYGEASGILSDLNLLSEDVSADIELTQDKVLEGIANLRQTYLNETPEQSAEKVGINTVDETQPVESRSIPETDSAGKIESKAIDAVKDNVSNLDFSDSFSALQYGEGRSFSFELETKDGDIVTIEASSLLALQAEQGRGTQDGYSFQYQSYAGYQESEFSFSVQGELDEDEVAAINDLLNNVNDLADDFYSGDLSTAFEKALELGFDSSEISGFALSLMQVQNVKAIQTYQPEQQILKPSVMAELKPIGKFASELSRSLTIANESFAHPRELLNSILQQMDELNRPQIPDDNGYNFVSISESILTSLQTIRENSSQN